MFRPWGLAALLFRPKLRPQSQPVCTTGRLPCDAEKLVPACRADVQSWIHWLHIVLGGLLFFGQTEEKT